MEPKYPFLKQRVEVGTGDFCWVVYFGSYVNRLSDLPFPSETKQSMGEAWRSLLFFFYFRLYFTSQVRRSVAKGASAYFAPQRGIHGTGHAHAHALLRLLALRPTWEMSVWNSCSLVLTWNEERFPSGSRFPASRAGRSVALELVVNRVGTTRNFKIASRTKILSALNGCVPSLRYVSCSKKTSPMRSNQLRTIRRCGSLNIGSIK